MYPTVEQIMSEDALSFIAGWADHTQLCTKSVKLIHRSNSTVAKSKGPSNPIMFNTIADTFMLNNLQTFHATALGKSRVARRGSMQIKRHTLLEHKSRPEGQTGRRG
jgi:hypothetical protein